MSKPTAASKPILCCVCNRNPVCECNWYPVCGEKSCNAIYQLCFGGVADGVNAAKTASLESLEFAFEYLIKTPHPQKTLAKGIAREIRKRLKAVKIKPQEGK
jgi:hypothetical protein